MKYNLLMILKEFKISKILGIREHKGIQELQDRWTELQVPSSAKELATFLAAELF